MTCLHCQGKMKRGVAPFSLDRLGYHIAWDAIPAWVCTQCGEPFFETREVELIQKALAAVDQQTAQIAAAQAS
jgi:YgiT-type zinc finger domain-containing protein